MVGVGGQAGGKGAGDQGRHVCSRGRHASANEGHGVGGDVGFDVCRGPACERCVDWLAERAGPEGGSSRSLARALRLLRCARGLASTHASPPKCIHTDTPHTHERPALTSTYVSSSSSKYPDRLPFQKKVTWPAGRGGWSGAACRGEPEPRPRRGSTHARSGSAQSRPQPALPPPAAPRQAVQHTRAPLPPRRLPCPPAGPYTRPPHQTSASRSTQRCAARSWPGTRLRWARGVEGVGARGRQARGAGWEARAPRGAFSARGSLGGLGSARRSGGRRAVERAWPPALPGPGARSPPGPSAPPEVPEMAGGGTR